MELFRAMEWGNLYHSRSHWTPPPISHSHYAQGWWQLESNIWGITGLPTTAVKMYLGIQPKFYLTSAFHWNK